jgi:hypothetical protein
MSDPYKNVTRPSEADASRLAWVAYANKLEAELRNLRALGDICVRRCNTAEARVQELESWVAYVRDCNSTVAAMADVGLEEK